MFFGSYLGITAKIATKAIILLKLPVKSALSFGEGMRIVRRRKY